MESVEANIVTTNKPLYDGIIMDNIYHQEFDNDPCDDDVILTYGQYIKYQNTEESGEANMEDLDKYIGSHVMVTGKDYINFLTKVRADNLVDDQNNNPITDTKIYELEFPEGPVEG